MTIDDAKIARLNDATESTTIWRYMDLPKFIAMLSTRKLRFTRLATYKDDPWEGFCDVKVPDIPSEVLEHSAGHALYQKASTYSAQEHRDAGLRLYVSCWCLWRESMSMWDLYGSRGTGVALTSTPARFRQAADVAHLRKEQYAFGPVEYHEDLESAEVIRRDLTRGVPLSGPLWQSILALAFQKRCGFEAEKEWRAALYQPSEQTSVGVDIDCDLDVLIDDVYVGPRADPFIHSVVTDVTSKYALRKPVKHSSLLNGPIGVARS